jgi:tyrosyl-tRNA synthetase
LILADTKLEFGLLPPDNKLILIDELLTPDSSRYWSAADYAPGRGQASFDKQYLRDWLISNDLKNAEGVKLPEDVVLRTREKYEEARDRVMSLGAFAPKGKVGVQVDAGEAGLQTDQVTEAVKGLKV